MEAGQAIRNKLYDELKPISQIVLWKHGINVRFNQTLQDNEVQSESEGSLQMNSYTGYRYLIQKLGLSDGVDGSIHMAKCLIKDFLNTK